MGLKMIPLGRCLVWELGLDRVSERCFVGSVEDAVVLVRWMDGVG